MYYIEEFKKLNSKPMKNRKVAAAGSKKKLNESDSRLSDRRFYFPSKLHDIIESLILQNGKEAASDLLSDLMDDFGLSYTPSNSREKYVDRVLKNIKNLRDTDKKTFDKLYKNIKFDDLLHESISIRAIDADDEIYHDIDFVLAKDIYYAPSVEDLGLDISEARDIGFKINVDGSVIIPKSTPFHLTMRGSYTGFPQFVFNRSGENFDISQDDNGLNLIYVYKNKV